MQLNKLLPGIFLTAMVLISSCESFLEPSPDNIFDDSRILEDAPFAEGLLLNAYNGLPNNYSFNETATDDAVSNDEGSIYTRIAVGEWSSQFNPVSAWDPSYEQIYYLNLFLSLAPDVEWSWESEVRDELFRNRFTGEALALRAWYNFQLLQNHGGISAEGNPLGFVILRSETISEENDILSLPRNTYEECVQFILDDIEEASTLLPDEYENSEDLNYSQVFGAQNENRISGNAVKALKARVLLHVASQSFNESAGQWEAAANAAAEVLDGIGGVSGLSPSGIEWYKNQDDADIIWRRDFSNINSWEAENFPPSLFGNGRTNPSQNLIDAFPMLNGYPTSAPGSGYDVNDPYANRDPRLTAYVVYDGNDIGGKEINTNVEAPVDGINNTVSSTRTGYYLKKLLRENVNLDPSINSIQPHFYTFFRYTEMFLIYAEAANEAWGPNADPMGHGFTAADVIGALRQRAGITQPDQFLATASAAQDAMRELIRNERRIELCFEGFRFWDVRRWGLDLGTTAKGVQISNGNYNEINVENRLYQPYMIYGPIPYEELLRDRNLVQNTGW